MTFQNVLSLQNQLAELQSNGTIRHLLRNVAQNAQDETIDLASSPDQVLACGELPELKPALFSIRAFLQNVYYWTCTVKEEDLLFLTFLYENHTRLQKYLVVAKILDHANLQSFGTAEEPVNPMLTDIPTYARLWTLINKFQRNGALQELHKDNLAQLDDMPDEFKFLCPSSDREAFRKRCS